MLNKNKSSLLKYNYQLKNLINNKLIENKNLNIKKKIQFLKNNFLDSGQKYIILKNFSSDKNKIIKFSSFFGKILAQNITGKKYLIVKPSIKKLKYKSVKKIREKLRYHQTNLGGSIHSDGPQLSVPPKYVIMGCLHQAQKGGSSILVAMDKIYDFLKRKNPKILNILQKEFFFERRGFGNKIFSKPIFKKKKNKITFRYLREYIEAGHKIKNKILDKKRINALNTLDSLMMQKKFQERYRMSKGDLIILNNDIMAHGRSGFTLGKNIKKRSLIRLWTR